MFFSQAPKDVVRVQQRLSIHKLLLGGCQFAIHVQQANLPRVRLRCHNDHPVTFDNISEDQEYSIGQRMSIIRPRCVSKPRPLRKRIHPVV